MASINNTPRPAYVYDTATNEWIPIGVGAHSHNEIPKTVVDAKGDLIVGTAADEVNRLAVGSNGYTLVADSSTSTGLAYAGTTQGNPVLNSAFQIWQRGTSISVAASTSSQYTVDRWNLGTSTNQACTVSRQTTSDTTNLPNIQYCARVQRNSGQTGTGNIYFAQSIESVNSIPFAGKTVTLSFYARKGSNFSATSDNLAVYLVGGTGTDENVLVSWTGASYPVNNQSATLTTTWQRFSWTGTVASTVTQLALYLNFKPTGTASTNDYFEVTGVQIDLGSTALPFRTYANTLQGELAACQRYFQIAGGTINFSIAQGQATGSGAGQTYFKHPVELRTAPALTVRGSFTDYLAITSTGGASGSAITSISLGVGSTQSSRVDFSGTSGLTAGNFTALQCSNANAVLWFSSEL